MQHSDTMCLPSTHASDVTVIKVLHILCMCGILILFIRFNIPLISRLHTSLSLHAHLAIQQVARGCKLVSVRWCRH